jgi:vanadium chloroperoxidase
MDAILFWNAVALEANRISHTKKPMEQAGPTLSSRALAIVHLAMYDAHQAIVPAPEGPYQAGLPAPPAGASAQSAVAGAAMTTLAALFPSQAKYFAEKLGELGGGLSPGFEYGVEVANRLLASRKNDPTASDAGYAPSNERGHHRPDPDNPKQGFHGPFYGARSRLFATQRLTLDPPPFNNDEYIAALRQVRGQGIAPELLGTLPSPGGRRTNDQTVIGLYWGYDGAAGLGTPPRLYNRIVRRVADARGNTEAQNARLFALVNAAMGDAAILAWDDKYRYDFWRPVLGLREHDTSLGPAGPDADNDLSNDTDIGWLPLGAPASNALNTELQTKTHGPYPCNESAPGWVKNFTPPFPAYPSGHATFGAAAFHATRLFYGVPVGDRKADKLFKDLDFVSEELDGETQDNRGTVRPRHRRKFEDGLWQMILENGASRVYLGVHWVFDAFALGPGNKPDFSRNVGGARLGIDIAEYIYSDGLKQSSGAPPRIT